MSEQDKTSEMPDARSFAERVFARLDSIDARLTNLEEAGERRALETKPIWERALNEITETRKEMRAGFRSIERQVGILSKDMLQMRASQSDFDERLAHIENK